MTEQGLNTSKYDRYKASSFRAFNWRLRDHFDTLYWLRVFGVPEWDQAIANTIYSLVLHY